MKNKIMASVMCMNMLCVQEDLALLEKAHIDYLHFDIMDNAFVPNITLSTDLIAAMRRATAIPFDIHLMVCQPERMIERIELFPDDYVSIHVEATNQAQRILKTIRERGARPAIALNPSTPVAMAEELIPDVDMVLVMTVNPGFAGQELVPQTIGKIGRMKRLLLEQGADGVEIEVDGNVSFENALKMKDAGASMFVAGSASVFHKRLGILEGSKRLREVLQTK